MKLKLRISTTEVENNQVYSIEVNIDTDLLKTMDENIVKAALGSHVYHNIQLLTKKVEGTMSEEEIIMANGSSIKIITGDPINSGKAFNEMFEAGIDRPSYY